MVQLDDYIRVKEGFGSCGWVEIVAFLIFLIFGYKYARTGELNVYWFAGIGAIAFVAGVIQFCPVWKLFGVSTCSSR